MACLLIQMNLRSGKMEKTAIVLLLLYGTMLCNILFVFIALVMLNTVLYGCDAPTRELNYRLPAIFCNVPHMAVNSIIKEKLPMARQIKTCEHSR